MIGVSIVSYYKSLIMVLLALLVCVSLAAASPATAAAGRAEEVHLVPAVYVFGDSTVDVGNNQYLPGNSALQLPYGIDFPHSRPTGRFSNGYNVADFVAKLLGFKRSPPAYLSLTPRTSRQILRGLRGVNYASGGSGILDTTGNTITLTKQIEYFAATKSKMVANSGSGSSSSSSVDELLSKSLFLISDGGNDMFAFLQRNGTASEVPSLYADLLSNYTRHVRALHGLGRAAGGALLRGELLQRGVPLHGAPGRGRVQGGGQRVLRRRAAQRADRVHAQRHLLLRPRRVPVLGRGARHAGHVQEGRRGYLLRAAADGLRRAHQLQAAGVFLMLGILNFLN